MTTTVDEMIANKLCWHRTVVFPSTPLSVLATMSDDVLRNFIVWNNEKARNDVDERIKMRMELEDWETENGQDALYWSMRVERDRELMLLSKYVGDSDTARNVLLKRIESKYEWRFLKSELTDKINQMKSDVFANINDDDDDFQ
jgi:hypothetical protein